MIRFVAGIAEIVEGMEAAAAFYRDRLGLEVEPVEGLGYAEVKVPGIMHFGLWDRSAAAEATLGDASRANEIPLGFSVGFEVDAVTAAATTIGDAVQPPQLEPWGQTTARFFSASGALFEVCETPGARELGGEGN